jgi:hypothetical protein
VRWQRNLLDKIDSFDDWCFDEYAWFNGVNRFKYWFRTKVLTPEVFTMMVIMALVTTFMTGPALNLIGYIFKNKKHVEAVESIEESKYRILFL